MWYTYVYGDRIEEEKEAARVKPTQQKEKTVSSERESDSDKAS
jgi:hypothetical protein